MSERHHVVLEDLRRARAAPRGALLLVFVLFALVPLANASPPDQTWISGFYDNSDYDDVVLIATSTVGTVDVRPVVPDRSLLVVVGAAPAAEVTSPPLALPSCSQGRAPPHS